MDVFLSFSFRPEDRELVDQLQQLVRAHGIRAVTGRRNDGGDLTEEIKKKIEEADALVALMTRRDPIGDAADMIWRTHPWVRDELNHAREKESLAIALLEEGVENVGMYAERERVPLDIADPLPAFLALAEHLANWKNRLGRDLRVRVLPGEIGHEVETCRYRFWTDGQHGDWFDATLIPAQGGTELYVRGVPDERALIQLEVARNGTDAWRSVATSQHVTVELNEAGGAQ